MSDNASLTLEQSLAHTEADALETLSAAQDLLRPLRRPARGGGKGQFSRDRQVHRGGPGSP